MCRIVSILSFAVLTSACAAVPVTVVFDFPEEGGSNACRVLNAYAEAKRCQMMAAFSGADKIRRTLESAKDKTAVFASIGPASSLRGALADKGVRALVARKVACWYAFDGEGVRDISPVKVIEVGDPFVRPETVAFAAVNGTDRYFKVVEDAHVSRLALALGKPRYNYPMFTINAMLDELLTRIPLSERCDEHAMARKRSKCSFDKHVIRMFRDGRILWEFDASNQATGPRFSALSLPSGKKGGCVAVAADVAKTEFVKRSYALDDLDSIINLELRGFGADGSCSYEERQQVVVDPPDPKGGYRAVVRRHLKVLKDIPLSSILAGMEIEVDPSASLNRVGGLAGYSVDLSRSDSGEGISVTRLRLPGGAVPRTSKDGSRLRLEQEGQTLLQGHEYDIDYLISVHADKRVRGSLDRRPVERMGRGLFSSITEEGTYISWRLLQEDGADARFDVWRRLDGCIEKVTASPVAQTTDFLLRGVFDERAEYSVDGKTFCPIRGKYDRCAPYVSIKLRNPKDRPALVGVGDLNGDGAYDFVIKTPTGGTDPWDLVYKPAARTCRLEAYDSSGRYLWTYEHGWNIEMGEWYSPYLVVDMDGDGRAEVVTKAAPLEPDYRDPDGRVQRGPEYLAVLDGLTGKIRTTAPWIERAAPDPCEDYDQFASRNQIALAYLDGKTPCVVVERGTYKRMIVDAWCLRNGKLDRLWRFDNEFLPRRYRGQGDHACLCEDVDGDGCDEVLIGSLTLDHDGTILWCNGRGHSDAHYYGELDPDRPGMELAFIYETAQPKGGGLLMCDPVNGEEIWKLPEPTRHVHGFGICSDLAPEYRGLEFYGQEVDQRNNSAANTHPRSDNRWFYTANGTLLSSFTNCVYNYGNWKFSAFWDGDLQREVINGAIVDHEGSSLTKVLPERLICLDLWGDWREEFITGCPGELRIYSTDIPAMDRRKPLMLDRIYRSRVTMETSGYSQTPVMAYQPSVQAINVSLRIEKGGRSLRIDVTPPDGSDIKGKLSLVCPPGWLAEGGKWNVVVPSKGVWTKRVALKRPLKVNGRVWFEAKLDAGNLGVRVIRHPYVE